VKTLPTAAEIENTFALAEREITTARAIAVAAWIASWADPDQADAEPFSAGDYARRDYLAYKDALTEAGDPAKIAIRMRREAASLDRAAERHMQDGLDYDAQAQRRERNGVDSTDHRAMARGCFKLQAAKDEKAFKLRLRASELEARAEFAALAQEVAA
jgi:hypothetical protein